VTVAWDLVRGNWVEPSTQILRAAVRPGETVVDVGANFGFFAYYLSRAVGSEGKVYAFEPIPYSRRVLKNVRAIFGLRNVEIMAMACGDRRGEIEMVAPVQESGAISAGLAHFAERDPRRGSPEPVMGKHYVAPLVTLDDLIETFGTVSLIKCDVEGAELLVLRGARELLRRSKPTVICELVPEMLRGFGVERVHVATYFRDLGYDAFNMDSVSGGLRLTPTDFALPGNYLFIHSERAARFAGMISEPAVATAGT
jgi:FkbM family methyltransferase